MTPPANRPAIAEFAKTMIVEWPKTQPGGGHRINPNYPKVFGRVQELLETHPVLTLQVLRSAYRMYLTGEPKRWRSPQSWLCPVWKSEPEDREEEGNIELGPWGPYVRMALYEARTGRPFFQDDPPDLRSDSNEADFDCPF